MTEAFGFHGQKLEFRSRKLLDTAAEGVCQNCGAEDGTVVAAHGNEAIMGKGVWLKAHDCFHAHLCFRCHAYIDRQSRDDPTGLWHDNDEDRKECFRRAMFRTTLWLFLTGRVRVA